MLPRRSGIEREGGGVAAKETMRRTTLRTMIIIVNMTETETDIRNLGGIGSGREIIVIGIEDLRDGRPNIVTKTENETKITSLIGGACHILAAAHRRGAGPIGREVGKDTATGNTAKGIMMVTAIGTEIMKEDAIEPEIEITGHPVARVTVINHALGLAARP